MHPPFSIEIASKYTQITKSKKMSKSRQKFEFRMKPKLQLFFPNASRSLLCIWFAVVAFQSEEEVLWRRGPPWPNLAPPWIRPWADLSKNNNTCKGPRVLHPYQVSSSGFGEEVENVNCLTDDRRTTDAGQRVITIGHWSLWLLCPKKHFHLSCLSYYSFKIGLEINREETTSQQWHFKRNYK